MPHWLCLHLPVGGINNSFLKYEKSKFTSHEYIFSSFLTEVGQQQNTGTSPAHIVVVFNMLANSRLFNYIH